MEKMETIKPNQPNVVLAEPQKNFFERAYDKLPTKAKIAMAVLVGSLAIAGCANAESHSSSPNSPVTTAEAKVNCGDFNNANAAANASKYLPNSFLPKGELNSNSSANSYVHNLFGKNGPLAGNGDLGSLAAIDAIITKPASKGIVNPNSYSYQDAFSTSIATFSSADGGREAQDNACRQAFITMTEDGNWNNNWAGQGQVVTEIIPTRNTNNNQIETNNGTDLVLQQVHLTGALNGVEFKSRNPNQKGYTPVLITNQGNIFVQGVLSLEGSANNNETGKSASSNGETIYVQPNGTQITIKVGANGEKTTITQLPNGTTITKNPNGTTTITKPTSGGGSGSGNSGSGSGGGNGGGSGSGNSGSGSGGGNGGGGETTTTVPETTTTIPETTTTVPPTTTTTQPGTKGTSPPVTVCNQYNPC